ncbi:MAG: hypothetical protein AAF625_06290 [Pseudomonadota bacterium]
MIWNTDTHQFTATICQRTGKTCPALIRMASAMNSAITQAGTLTKEDFEIEGNVELTHCQDGCIARFRAGPDTIRVFCGSDPATETKKLDHYADLMFGSDAHMQVSCSITTPPCAMLEARVLPPGRPVAANQGLEARS